MLLRKAKEEELEEIMKIEQMSFKSPYSSSFMRQLLAEEDFFVAEVDGKIVGYITGRKGYVISIAVHPDYRKKGIGSKLVQLLIDLYKKEGIKKLRLHVRESNREARQFYAKIGFREKGKVPSYYTDGEDAILCEKDL